MRVPCCAQAYMSLFLTVAFAGIMDFQKTAHIATSSQLSELPAPKAVKRSLALFVDTSPASYTALARALDDIHKDSDVLHIAHVVVNEDFKDETVNPVR